MMSLDGFYTGPGGDVMVLPDFDTFDRYNLERLRAAGTLLLGRTSYEGFKGYWPPVADDPEASPTHREISERNNAIDKVVVSDSLTTEEIAPWHNTRIVKRADAHEQIADLKRESGGDVLVFGSRTLWSDLLANDLVDELHLIVGGRVLGAGTPIFESAPPASLVLLETRSWEGSDNVLLRYGARAESRGS
jgi:dihydrofolate reductase